MLKLTKSQRLTLSMKQKPIATRTPRGMILLAKTTTATKVVVIISIMKFMKVTTRLRTKMVMSLTSRIVFTRHRSFMLIKLSQTSME